MAGKCKFPYPTHFFGSSAGGNCESQTPPPPPPQSEPQLLDLLQSFVAVATSFSLSSNSPSFILTTFVHAEFIASDSRTCSSRKRNSLYTYIRSTKPESPRGHGNSHHREPLPRRTFISYNRTKHFSSIRGPSIRLPLHTPRPKTSQTAYRSPTHPSAQAPNQWRQSKSWKASSTTILLWRLLYKTSRAQAAARSTSPLALVTPLIIPASVQIRTRR